MIVLFLFFFFMKSYVVGTHNYNHLLNTILICNHSNSFYEEISKELSDSFYCLPFLLGERLTKDSLDSAGKKNK